MIEAPAMISLHPLLHPWMYRPAPSCADIEVTKGVQDVAAKHGITLRDHLIISREGPASFKSLGLL